MSYDNYHYTTKVTTTTDNEYELVGDERNMLAATRFGRVCARRRFGVCRFGVCPRWST